jgi:NAD(P)H-dependent flavin oxidoreductase YrpB (nitropropane dioxygenase family)
VPETPVLLAGGIATREDVRAALAAGAHAVVAGSRFVLTEEAHVHAGYKSRIAGARETLDTTLFGVGWPARHRVVPNAATRRWCDAGGKPPTWVRAVQRAAVPIMSLLPMGRADPTGGQRLAIPLYSPLALRPEGDERLLEVTPLYAGESVRRIERVVDAEDAVHMLTP